MDRIARIIELESAAAKPEQIASATRWEMSRLYWEEAQAGTSKTDIADKVGKSRPHVSYMVKCWEICGRKLMGSLADFPDFQSIYHSEQVRGPSAGTDYGSGEREPDDVHTRVSKLAALASAIAPDAGSLTAQERGRLRHAIRDLELALAREPGRTAA